MFKPIKYNNIKQLQKANIKYLQKFKADSLNITQILNKLIFCH